MRDLWTHLKETDKPVALYGTGDGADKIMARMKADGTLSKIRGIFASDGFVRSREFHGFEVESYSGCKERLGDMIVLMCFGSGRPEVLDNVYKIASENEFYAPDVPVVGGNVFDSSFYEANRDRINEARSCLTDELSVRTFDDTVRNKLTGEISYLRDCEVPQAEADSLLHISGGTMVDLGAYTGDTVVRYTSVFPGIEKVTAVEPDPRNYRKLCENVSGLQIPVRCINALIGKDEGMSFVAAGRSRGRGVRDAGDTDRGTKMPVTTVDAILDGAAVSFIKMDVEGAELDTLEGAGKTIRAYHPQMQIACYHRSEDIWTLPLRVLQICPDYKVYMRHMPHVPGWDTLFYFI